MFAAERVVNKWMEKFFKEAGWLRGWECLRWYVENSAEGNDWWYLVRTDWKLIKRWIDGDTTVLCYFV